MKPKSSFIWNYFLEIDHNYALCTLCNRKFSRRGRTTTPLRAHLSAKHPEIFDESFSATFTQPPPLVESLNSRDVQHLQSAPFSSVITKSSLIWKYFLPIDKDHVLCQLCNQCFIHEGSTTSTLKVHLQSQHSEILTYERAQQSHDYKSKADMAPPQQQQNEDVKQEQPDPTDDSRSNFGSFSNMEARPIQQVVEGNELYTILEPAPVRPTTLREKLPSAKRQKRMASDIHNDSYTENFENIENIEHTEYNEHFENTENIPNNQQTFEYPKWKEERYELFGKIALMKMHDITSDSQRLFAEKLINEALSLAELNLLTPSHAINAPFMPIRPPLVNRQFSGPAIAIRKQTSPRNRDIAADTRAEPDHLQDNNQNISMDTNVAAASNQNQNVNISRTTTNQQPIPHSDLKRTTPTTAAAPCKAKIERRPIDPGQRDASDAFGEHVAAKHRQYTDYVKSYVEHSVSQVLFEADMGKYDPSTGQWQNPGMQQRPITTKVNYTDAGTTNATSTGAALNTNSARATPRTKTTTVPQAITSAIQGTNVVRLQRTTTAASPVYPTSAQPSTSATYSTSAQPSTSAVQHTTTGATEQSRTKTAQHSNSATNIEQTHLLDPNIVIKSSPAHAPSYSSDIDDNDDESETVLSNTGAPPYVTNERMSDDDEEEFVHG